MTVGFNLDHFLSDLEIFPSTILNIPSHHQNIYTSTVTIYRSRLEMVRHQSREDSSSPTNFGVEKEKETEIPMQKMGVGQRNQDVEASSNPSDDPDADDAQAGVKNIEAVSMTWTKWGLIFAYLRFVGTN